LKYSTSKQGERDKLPKRWTNISVPKAGDGLGTEHSEYFQAVDGIRSWCKERGVFLVVFVTPHWYGQLNLSQHDLEVPLANNYIALLQELKRQPDCEVFVCDDFTDITDEGTDEDYLFDYGHMTEKGAKVYTNWLIDRMLETPKVAEALNRPKIF
jgi:hypothetical protein